MCAAAIRELWEEAGVRASRQLAAQCQTSEVVDHKPHKRSPVLDDKHALFVPRASYTAVEIAVAEDDAAAEWPEQGERQRRFVSVQEALNLIKWRRDIHELLRGSQIARGQDGPPAL